jgi:outer membrane receptor for ferrienterochelin and colicin
MKKRPRCRILASLPFFLLLACCIDAQATMLGTTGILEGRITDKQTGHPLAGVNVSVLESSRGAATDTDGFYQINHIPAGAYDVRFSLLGYQPIIVKAVVILPDLRNKVNLALEASTIELNVVEVRAERPMIQADQAATAYSVGEAKLEKLPVSTVREVLSLQPGTTLEGNVRGGKSTEVVFLVDGLPAQDLISGGLGGNIPKSSISGLTIYTGGFEAEYGNALAGVVNLITRTGSNTHSLATRLERDTWLPNSVQTEHSNLTEAEITGSGPIVRDRLFYFSANTLTLDDTRWWQDFRHFFNSPVNQELSGMTKLEYAASPQLRTSLQGIYSLHLWRDYEYSWRYNLSGLPPRSRDSYRIAATLSHTISNASYYTVTLSRHVLHSHVGEPTSEGDRGEPYQYDFFLRYIVGGSRNWWADTRQVVHTLKSDFTSQLWKMHVFKAGVEFNAYTISSDLIKYEPQLTYFGKPDADKPLLNYSNSYGYSPKSGSIFFQDKMQTERDGSSFSAGIRWDFLDPTAERPIVEFVPTRPNEYEQHLTGWTRARFKHQFSPRLALAVPLSERSFFFVNFGHYFQFPLFDYLYSGINPAQLRAGSKNILVGNPDLEPERTVAWEIGVKHSIREDVVASMTYFKKDMSNQLDAKTLIPFDSKSAGDYGFALYVNNAEATASGLELVVSRERDDRLSGSISYSLMFTEGVSEYVNQTINYAQWGFPLYPQPFPLSWDQRHTIKVDADFLAFLGIHGNANLLYNSPRPYTYYPTRDGFTPLDPTRVFIPNNRRMSSVFIVNLKLSRQFTFGTAHITTVTVYADVRNLLNAKNVRWIDSSGRIGGELNDPGAYYDPRRTRVGMRVGW